MSKIKFSVFTLSVLTIAACCGADMIYRNASCDEQSDRSLELSEERAILVEDNSLFAWDLYHQLRQDEDNLFFSPISVSAALDMTRLGANGQTLDEMATVLGNSQEEALHHAEQGSLLQELEDSDTCYVQLSIANRVFPQTGISLTESFEAGLDADYGASPEQLDYAGDSETARARINEWVSEQTQEKIPELFPAGTIDSSTRLVLANAIYMKADWARQFDAARTMDTSFSLLDGSTVSVPMMNNDLEEGLYYAEVDGAQLVELPYVGEELSMVIVVPDETDGLLSLEAEIDGYLVQDWFDALAPMAVAVSMPRLELRWKDFLNEPLMALGMETAFSDGADFSGMSEEISMMIDIVIHEAYIKIDEEGTEAAAATGVGMSETSEPEYQYVSADHPFLFLVRDRITDSVLFIGRVANPVAE